MSCLDRASSTQVINSAKGQDTRKTLLGTLARSAHYLSKLHCVAMRQKDMAGAKGYVEFEIGKNAVRDHQEVDEAEVMKKLNRNLLPLFFLTTVLCYVDRTNLAFAALQLNKSLGFTEKVYGLGSGIFFIGYSLFQVCLSLHSLHFGNQHLCCSLPHAPCPPL